jgi:hypothetical protein
MNQIVEPTPERKRRPVVDRAPLPVPRRRRESKDARDGLSRRSAAKVEWGRRSAANAESAAPTDLGNIMARNMTIFSIDL